MEPVRTVLVESVVTGRVQSVGTRLLEPVETGLVEERPQTKVIWWFFRCPAEEGDGERGAVRGPLAFYTNIYGELCLQSSSGELLPGVWIT